MALVEREPSNIYYGERSVRAIYRGNTKVWGNDLKIDFLLVGGGGGGGAGVCCGSTSYSYNGGGGAGGVIRGESYKLERGTYCVVVGSGGKGGCFNAARMGCNGGNTTFNGMTAYGGGGGGGDGCRGNNGGSGGGGGYYNANCPGGSGCPGQGNNGGTGTCSRGGGGGGAGGAGSAGDTNSGIGGKGIYSSIDGQGCRYAGGGGGVAGKTSAWCNCGTMYCGGGGNATSSNQEGGMTSCCGQNGIVIIRYPISSGIEATGGSIKTWCGYRIHTFTSNGVFSY